jgi:hypothetical protein
MAISCGQFSDYIARKVEHLDDNIILSMHPLDSQWIGHVSTGRFPAEQGIEHTYDRFENVFPILPAWNDVQSAACIGTPCDPAVNNVGLGFTRAAYRLQQIDYGTDLFCWDLILSADRATQQFAHFVRVLRRISTIVWSHRFRTQALQNAKYRWVCNNNGLTNVVGTWDAAMQNLTLTPVTAGTSALPTSKLGARHLQRRVDPQIRAGAEGPTINKSVQPMLELVTHMETVWNLVEGNPELTDHWRFRLFEEAAKYYKYGWTGSVGNFGLRADAYSLRFNIVSYNTVTGVLVLNVVFPYTNVAATEGIKEDVNADYDNAAIQVDYIWHRKAMTSLVRDAKAINPEMPFAARDFAGKWQFVMDNLTCGNVSVADLITGTTKTIPVAVNNELRNKGKFRTSFGGAIQTEYPELAEVFISLREPAAIVDIPVCQTYPSPYPFQNYQSANAVCPDTASGTGTTLTFTPSLQATTGTYEIANNAVTCNGMLIAHDAITGTSTLATLVAQMNTILGEMGTWAVSGQNITLASTNCTVVALPWSV